MQVALLVELTKDRVQADVGANVDLGHMAGVEIAQALATAHDATRRIAAFGAVEGVAVDLMLDAQ